MGAEGAPSNGVQAAAPGLAVIQLQTVCGLAGAQRHGTVAPHTGRAEQRPQHGLYQVSTVIALRGMNVVSLTCGPALPRVSDDGSAQGQVAERAVESIM